MKWEERYNNEKDYFSIRYNCRFISFANKPIHQKSIEKEWGREIMKLEVNGYTFEIELENNTSAKSI